MYSGYSCSSKVLVIFKIINANCFQLLIKLIKFQWSVLGNCQTMSLDQV